MITADTNLLVRIVVRDDEDQWRRAREELAHADGVIITTAALCEFCWVLRSGYRYPAGQIAEAVQALTEAPNVVVDDASVRAGLDLLRAGGDFADGVIAELGARHGSAAFVSFDRAAVRRVNAAGLVAREPA